MSVQRYSLWFLWESAPISCLASAFHYNIARNLELLCVRWCHVTCPMSVPVDCTLPALPYWKCLSIHRWGACSSLSIWGISWQDCASWGTAQPRRRLSRLQKAEWRYKVSVMLPHYLEVVSVTFFSWLFHVHLKKCNHMKSFYFSFFFWGYCQTKSGAVFLYLFGSPVERDSHQNSQRCQTSVVQKFFHYHLSKPKSHPSKVALQINATLGLHKCE